MVKNADAVGWRTNVYCHQCHIQDEAFEEIYGHMSFTHLSCCGTLLIEVVSL